MRPPSQRDEEVGEAKCQAGQCHRLHVARDGLRRVLVVDGNEATEVLEADPGRFVLVLLDLTMLHKDGEHTSRPGQLDV